MKQNQVFIFYVALSVILASLAYRTSSSENKVVHGLGGVVAGAGISFLLYQKFKDQIYDN